MSNNKLSVAWRSFNKPSRPVRSSKYSVSVVVLAFNIISLSRFVKSLSFGWRYWERFLAKSICAVTLASNSGFLRLSEAIRAVFKSWVVVGIGLSKKKATFCIMSL